MKKATKKSSLAKQAEKLFSFHDSEIAVPPEPIPAPPASPVFVQTFTTYSVCEEPIPNLRKQQQA